MNWALYGAISMLIVPDLYDRKQWNIFWNNKTFTDIFILKFTKQQSQQSSQDVNRHVKN